jgi:hypothetical protein
VNNRDRLLRELEPELTETTDALREALEALWPHVDKYGDGIARLRAVLGIALGGRQVDQQVWTAEPNQMPTSRTVREQWLFDVWDAPSREVPVPMPSRHLYDHVDEPAVEQEPVEA